MKRFNPAALLLVLVCSATLASPNEGGPRGPMMDGRGGPGMHLPPGVKLTEAQQDKVFAIVHAQEPQQREQMQDMRKAHEALGALVADGKFDEAKAAPLAAAVGKAAAALALSKARTDAQINAVLTPEQRKAAAEAHERGPMRPDAHR